MAKAWLPIEGKVPAGAMVARLGRETGFIQWWGLWHEPHVIPGPKQVEGEPVTHWWADVDELVALEAVAETARPCRHDVIELIGINRWRELPTTGSFDQALTALDRVRGGDA